MHQYARYFERFRAIAASRPIEELVSTDILADLAASLGINVESIQAQSNSEQERELRSKIDSLHLEAYQRTQTETTKRWTYEQEVKRPYFHITELDEAQLANWRKYLDFEENEGDYQRIVFLYERCLVAAAYYDEFWLRYARWMSAQPNRDEEVRNIFIRASCLFVPISRPFVRLQYARFEEMSGNLDIAQAIHEAILIPLPNHVETIVSWADLQRRQYGIEAAIEVYSNQIESQAANIQTKGAVIAEWARLFWQGNGAVDEARALYQKNINSYVGVQAFWDGYLKFEIEQPASAESESKQHARIKQVYEHIRQSADLSKEVTTELSQVYLYYLMRKGGKDAAKEYMQIDREING
jgi:pre-mRNA-processing factor 39